MGKHEDKNMTWKTLLPEERKNKQQSDTMMSWPPLPG